MIKSSITNKRILNWVIYILNFLLLIFIFSYTIFFFLVSKNILLIYFIIIFSICALFLKLIYWLSIKDLLILDLNRFELFLLRISVCLLVYITPAYYIFKQKSLVMNNDIIFITLIIISILASVGTTIERYLFFTESKNIKGINYDEKLF